LKTTTEIDFQIQPWQRQDLLPRQWERFIRVIKAVDIKVKRRGWSMKDKRHRQSFLAEVVSIAHTGWPIVKHQPDILCTAESRRSIHASLQAPGAYWGFKTNYLGCQ